MIPVKYCSMVSCFVCISVQSAVTYFLFEPLNVQLHPPVFMSNFTV